MAQLFKCYVCEQYFDQYGLELHFVMTHKLDDEEEKENPFAAESDLPKNFNNVHEANNDAHEKSKGIILEPRDNISTVSQRPIAVKVPDQQVFYILYIDK